MESTFQTGHQWTESNYFVSILENNVAPVGGSLLLIFIIALIYVCIVKKKSVHEFTRLFALVSSLTMVMLAFSYNLMDDTTLLRTRVNNILAYKEKMSAQIKLVDDAVLNLVPYMFDSGCSQNDNTICKQANFYKDTQNVSNNIHTEISKIKDQVDSVLNASQQNMLQDFLSLIQSYLNLLQTVIYGLFIGIATLLWVSIVRKMSGRCILHGIGGLLSFCCLIIGIVLLFGSHGIADLCKDPLETISFFTTNSYVTFYFTCVPAPNGVYPSELDDVLPLLRYDKLFAGTYYELCRIVDNPYDPDTPIIDLNSLPPANLTILKQGCPCTCNKSTVTDVLYGIGSAQDRTGLLGMFECKVPREKINGLTGAICSYFSAFVGYFFLLLSLSGHAMFLFYFVPKA